MITPRTMKETLPRVFRLSGETPMIQDAISTATGVVACERALGCVNNVGDIKIAHLEHLDEGDREVKIGHVTANE
jgi:hypothetical protein